jgi:hypothetical protein
MAASWDKLHEDVGFLDTITAVAAVQGTVSAETTALVEEVETHAREYLETMTRSYRDEAEVARRSIGRIAGLRTLGLLQLPDA